MINVTVITIAGLFALFLLYVMANVAYKRTNAYKNRFVAINNYLKGVPAELNVAALGSTYGKFAFNDLEKYGSKAFNFCIPGECLEADLSIIRNYKDRFSRGSLVFINLSACVAMYTLRDANKKNFELYPRILGGKNNVARGLRWSLKRCFPLGLKNWKQLARVIFDVPLKKNILENYKQVYDCNKAKENMNRMAQGWIRMFQLESLKCDNYPEQIKRNVKKNVDNLSLIIDECISADLHPVIIVPPVSKDLSDFFSAEFLKASLGKLFEVANSRAIPVIDFFHHSEFKENLSLFQDGGFRLSSLGSQKFLKLLVSELKNFNLVLDNAFLGNV